MPNNIPEAWARCLSASVLATAEMAWNRVHEERAHQVIFPPEHLIYNALALTPPDKVKAVIVGQDPYHEPSQAMGLSFSVPSGVLFPPSLRNIFSELVSDLGVRYPRCGDLTPWAERGVLLLNSSLTVAAHRAGSHLDYGWQELTRAIVTHCMTLPQPVVFICWGVPARKLVESASQELADSAHKLVKKIGITSTHPSPLSANRRTAELQPFVNSKPFSHTNRLLVDMGAEPIDWSL